MEEVFYLTPQFWVAASFGVFVVLMFRPLARAIAKALDNRSSQIAGELAEARRLREEAQEVLSAYQKKQRESLQEAEAMIAATRADAARIVNKAEADLKIALEKRMKQAMDRIAQSEAKAVQDVQAYVAEIALVAARKVIAEHLEKGGNDDLIRKASADVAAKMH